MAGKKMTKKALRLSQYADKTFEFYSTTRHGYLKVPKELIKDLNIDLDISTFSYKCKTDGVLYVYLEEDRDAGIFLDHYTQYFGHQPALTKQYVEDEIFIAGKQRYQSKWWWEREMIRQSSNFFDEKEDDPA